MRAGQLGKLMLCASILLLGACGGGGSGEQPTSVTGPLSFAQVSLLYSESAAPKTVCPTGGTRIDSGFDSNKNGTLDPSEITNTQNVCNVFNGPTTLVSSAVEPPGSNCPNGGYRINAGLDTNGDGILEASEVTSTAFACNGAPGATGAPGAPGATSLIAITAEPPGANCASGGSKVTSGVDSNRDGMLQSGEVTSTGYVCNGASSSVTNPAGCTVSNAPLAWAPGGAISLASTDPDPNNPPGQINVGTSVFLRPNVVDTNSCPGSVITETVSWTLISSPTGSGVVRAATLPEFVFAPDKAGAYMFEVVVTNSLGLSTPPATISIQTSSCGVNPLMASAQAIGFASPAGTDLANSIPVTASSSISMTAAATTADNSVSCPARFGTAVSYNWSVINSPFAANGQLTNVTGQQTAYQFGTVAGLYQIQVVAHDSNGTASNPAVLYFQLQ